MGCKESNMFDLTADEFVQAWFALWMLATLALYLALGGSLVEWWTRRKDK